MISFSLVCNTCGHGYTSWFSSSVSFNDLNEQHLIDCPKCSGTDVSKGVQKPNVITKGLSKKERTEVYDNLVTSIESTTEDVGERFAEEARKIHYGESEERNIRGNISVEEYKELTAEGVDFFPYKIHGSSKKKQ